MSDSLPYGVFLSHSSKHKSIVRPLVEQLGADGLKMLKDKVGFHPSAFILQPLQRAFGSDRAQLEAGILPFRDSLHFAGLRRGELERRLIPLRIDDAGKMETAAEVARNPRAHA